MAHVKAGYREQKLNQQAIESWRTINLDISSLEIKETIGAVENL